MTHSTNIMTSHNMTHFRIDIQFNLFLQLYEYDQTIMAPVIQIWFL